MIALHDDRLEAGRSELALGVSGGDLITLRPCISSLERVRGKEVNMMTNGFSRSQDFFIIYAKQEQKV